MAPETVKKQAAEALKADPKRGTLDPVAYAAGYQAGVKHSIGVIRGDLQKILATLKEEE
jgi:hypothetical protein